MATPMEVDTPESLENPLQDQFDRAKEVEDRDANKAIAIYQEIIKSDDDTEQGMKVQESAVYALAAIYVKQKSADSLAKLTKDIRPFCVNLPKAKTAKIVRTLIDMMSQIPGTLRMQIGLCQDCVEWCLQEKRTFLRQRVETKLASLYVDDSKFQQAIELLQTLLRDVKKMDDKLLLVEVHLIECRTHFKLRNIPKAKAGLTASKTNANAIHCPPLLQAEIDLWSGIIHAREKDFVTAGSYFYEAFETFNGSGDARAAGALKYQLLAKIMAGSPGEVLAISAQKAVLKYVGQVDAFLAIAKAHQNRSLLEFESHLETHKEELRGDEIVAFHIADLNETMLEENLKRLIEPFSSVEIAHVAELINLPLARVQYKLSEMILDDKILGTLDQGRGVLIVFDKAPLRTTYENVLKCIKNTSDVLDTLYQKAQKLA